MSWAASTPAETFQRAAERRIGSRKRSGTKEGRLAVGSASAPPAGIPTESPASEHGAGPPVKPKCQGSQVCVPFSEGLGFPRFLVQL